MQISDFSGLAFRRFSGKAQPGIILFPGCFVFRLRSVYKELHADRETGC